MTPYVSLLSGGKKHGQPLPGPVVSPQAASRMAMVRRRVMCSSAVALSRCRQTPSLCAQASSRAACLGSSSKSP